MTSASENAGVGEPVGIELVTLFDGRLKLFQARRGYRFSIDAVLLAHFAAGRAAGAVVDLGTGSGILPVVLARRERVTRIAAVEIQEGLARLAQRNVEYNSCSGKVRIVRADVKSVRGMLPAEGFDTVVTNPPFYREGSGRINPECQSAIARHELAATLQDFLDAAAYVLRPAGRFLAVFLADRTVDLLAGMRARMIEPKTLRFVHPRADTPATSLLVEGVKSAGPGAAVLPPLVLYDGHGVYSREAAAMFSEL